MKGVIHFRAYIQKRKERRRQKKVEKRFKRVVKGYKTGTTAAFTGRLTPYETKCLFEGAPELFSCHNDKYDMRFDEAVMMCLELQAARNGTTRL
jgi:hypothetical protein